jgi:hypothetical protein
MKLTIVRTAATISGAALALGLSAPVAHAAPIPAPTGADPSPAAVGAAYLAKQPDPNDSIIRGTFPTVGVLDYGVTIDAAWALDAVGGQAAKVTAMTTALQSHIGDFSANGGQKAKMLAFLTSQGRTGAPIDNLRTGLEGNVTSGGAHDGELTGAGPFTQTYAAQALHNSGSTLGAAATTYLLKQQCPGGFIRGAFAGNGSACSSDTGEFADTDTTALAVFTLQSQKSDPAVAAAITKAVTWLAAQQHADGSFDGFSGPSANTTGLAGWAFGLAGRADLAAKAGGWVRSVQLANAGSCVKYAAKDNGAIVADPLSLTNAAAGPLDVFDADSANHATAQALPALVWTPGGAAAGETKLTAPAFAPAGSTQTVTVAGAPGDTVCASAGGAGTRITLPASGTAAYTVVLPAGTAKVTVTSVDAGVETDSTSIQGLAAAKLKAKAPKSVELGHKFNVKITGLAPGETVTVKYLGKKKTVTANAKGVAKVKLKASKAGTSKVKFTGEFGNRKGKVAVTVVR